MAVSLMAVSFVLVGIFFRCGLSVLFEIDDLLVVSVEQLELLEQVFACEGVLRHQNEL